MTCQEVHPAPPFEVFDPGQLRLRIAGNGAYQAVAHCRSCGGLSSPIPHYQVERLGLRVAALPLIADYRGSIGRCARQGCEQEAVEDHHFAPRQIFGDDTDEWPRALLCVDHHLEWHRRMEGLSA